MTKSFFQILAIVLFFFIVGYVLTYPYELSYHGSETVILLEDSYENTSLEELINRKEFKGKVLYIRIWEPFDTEVKPYTDKELKTFKSQLDSLKDDTDSDEYKLLAMKVEDRIVQAVSIEEQLNALEIISNKYKNSDVAFIYITDPDNHSESRKNDLRKWKTAVKKYETPGYHMIMNPELVRQIKQHLKERTNNSYLPFFLLANKLGNIVDYQAPWPQDTALLYPQINHLLSN
jgi:hypothetical protein